MAKIIRTSDLKGLVLQETPRPKYKPITSSALAKLPIVEEKIPDLSRVILPRRKIAETIVDTHRVDEFNEKYAKIIAEEKEALAKKKEAEADFTRAIEVKEVPKKKRTTRKKKAKEA